MPKPSPLLAPRTSARFPSKPVFMVRYETQPGVGLAVRKYVLKRRGIIAADTLRKPGPKLSPETIADIEWLMERIERSASARACVACRSR